MANVNALSLLANAKYKELSEMYGEDPQRWSMTGAATLIGADIAEGYSKWAQNSMQAQSLQKRQLEIDSRANISIANLLKQGEQVQSAQATSFIKSGVKLEGSALNVMSETLEQASEAARIKRREVDFEITQLKVEEAVARTRANHAFFETALNVASSVVGSGVLNSPSSTPSSFKYKELGQLNQFSGGSTAQSRSLLGGLA